MLLGAFKSKTVYAVLGAIGIILAAVYMLWMFQRVYLGEVKPENQDMKDLSAREEWTLIPLVVMIFVIGLFPAPFFSVMSNSVTAILERLPSLAAMH